MCVLKSPWYRPPGERHVKQRLTRHVHYLLGGCGNVHTNHITSIISYLSYLLGILEDENLDSVNPVNPVKFVNFGLGRYGLGFDRIDRRVSDEPYRRVYTKLPFTGNTHWTQE